MKPDDPSSSPRVRLDKWLWAARFVKTRALAVEEVERGRISVNGQPAKPSRELQPGDRLTLRQAGLEREFTVLGVSNQRGPAPVAQALYAETAQSQVRRAQWLEERRQGVEPALALTQARQGRPTKRDRRELAEWQRWSASVDDVKSGNKPGR